MAEKAILEIMLQAQLRRRRAMCERRHREPDDIPWHRGDGGEAGSGYGSGYEWKESAGHDALT